MRLVFECPDQPNFVTCVKVKGIFGFKGFESLFGTKVEKDLDVMGTLKNAFEKRTGIELNNKEVSRFSPKTKKSKIEVEIDFSRRILCSYGNCIGVINEQGVCNTCGKPYRREV